MSDKQTGKCVKSAINKVASEPGFYAPEVEKQLNERVELPGGNAIDKLLRGEGLLEPERVDLAAHIGTFIKRVPHRRRKAYSLIPYVIETTKLEMPVLLTEQAEKRGYPPADAEAEIKEATSFVDSFNDKLPDEIEAFIREPWPSKEMVLAISRMTWRILEPPRFKYFLTSDNPAVFFEDEGLNHDSGELVLPLSSNRALHGCFQPGASHLGFQKVGQGAVIAVNRRIAEGATRFVFYHERADWPMTLMRKRNVRRHFKFS